MRAVVLIAVLTACAGALFFLAALAGCGLAVDDRVPSRPQSGPPAPPTDLTVRIINRRDTSMEVCWRVGASAETFEVSYARVPITAANIDDRALVIRAPFAGQRRLYTTGERVCQLVGGLYIETGYYFAVRAVGGSQLPAAAAMEPTS